MLAPSEPRSGADVPVALDEVLERAQLAQPDRPARVQLLGRVADLRAHPELAPVGEARRGVHVHARRVHAQLEGARGGGVARDDRLGVPAAVAADVLDRLLDASRPRRRRGSSARYSVAQSSSVAGSTASGTPARRPRGRATCRQRQRALVGAHQHAGGAAARAAMRGRNSAATSSCTSSVSAALHTPGRWVLALSTIASACVEVGGGVDVDVAVARGGVDHGHRGDLLQRRLQALAAARDDQVDALLLGRQLGQLLAPAAGDEADAALGQPGRRRPPRRRSARAPRWSEPPWRSPRSTIALPDFRHSAAASIVTLGRAS